MTCHSSSVPITPMSAIQVDRAPTPKEASPSAPRTRLPDRPSSTASATIEATTEMTPSTITASFRAVGVVMNRVSTSMRADKPRLSRHLEVSEYTGDLRLLLRRERARGARDADEVGAHPRHVGPDVQHAAAARGHRGAWGHGGDRVAERDERRRRRSPGRTGRSWWLGGVRAARWKGPGRPSAGSVAMAWQGIETSRARGHRTPAGR